MNNLEKAYAEIKEQQAKMKPKSTEFFVGCQLRDILGEMPEYAEIVLTDLLAKGMTVSDCEKKIREFAKRNGGCCPPDEADRIIREFYGIPCGGPDQTKEPNREHGAGKKAKITFADFL